MSQSVTLRHAFHFRHDFDLTLRSKWYANTSKVEEKKQSGDWFSTNNSNNKQKSK